MSGKLKKATGLILLLSLVLGVAASGHSQSRLKDDAANKKSGTKLAKTEDRAAYSFEFAQGILKEALESLASKADLTLSYHSDLLRGSTIVNVTGSNLAISEALDKVLRNTGLDYQITGTHHLVVFKREKVGHLRGKIVGSKSGEPAMQGAKVYLLKSKTSMLPKAKLNFGRRTFIGADGEYEINNIKPGVYRLFIVQDGNKEIYKKVTIQEGKTIADYCRLKYPRF